MYIAGRPPILSDVDAQIRPSSYLRDDFDRLIVGILCVLAVVGAGLTLHELFLGRGQLLLTSFSSELARARTSRWELFFSGNVDVSPFRSLTVTSCLAIATLFALARKHKHRILLVISTISVVVVIAQSFLVAGRFLFGVLVLSLLVSTAFVNGGASMRRLFTLPRLIVGGTVAFYFLIVFPTQRNPALVEVVERSIQWSSDAELSGWVLWIGDMQGMAWIKILAYSLKYFSGSLDKLNYFVTETDVMSWYKLGSYNLTQVSQLLGAFLDGVTPWHQARLDIADIMKRAGWSLNPWATGIRDLGIDFGSVGATVVIGLLGFVGQKIYILSQTHGSYLSLIAATYVSLSCFIFAFVSPFQIRVLGNSFWLLGLLVILRYVVAKAAVGFRSID